MCVGSLGVIWEWINVILRKCHFVVSWDAVRTVNLLWKSPSAHSLSLELHKGDKHTHLQPPSKSSASLHLDGEVHKVTAQMGTAQSCISFHHRLSLSFLFLFLFLPSGKQWQQLEGHCRDLQAGTVNSCSAELKNRRCLSCCFLFSKASVEQNFKCFPPQIRLPIDFSSHQRWFPVVRMITKDKLSHIIASNRMWWRLCFHLISRKTSSCPLKRFELWRNSTVGLQGGEVSMQYSSEVTF